MPEPHEARAARHADRVRSVCGAERSRRGRGRSPAGKHGARSATRGLSPDGQGAKQTPHTRPAPLPRPSAAGDGRLDRELREARLAPLQGDTDPGGPPPGVLGRRKGPRRGGDGARPAEPLPGSHQRLLVLQGDIGAGDRAARAADTGGRAAKATEASTAPRVAFGVLQAPPQAPRPSAHVSLLLRGRGPCAFSGGPALPSCLSELLRPLLPPPRGKTVGSTLTRTWPSALDLSGDAKCRRKKWYIHLTFRNSTLLMPTQICPHFAKKVIIWVISCPRHPNTRKNT